MIERLLTTRGRRILLIAAGLVLLYLLFGYFVVPLVVERQLVSAVAEQTGITPSVEDVDFDPIGLRLTVEGFVLPDPEARSPFLSFDSFAADVRLLGFVFADVALDEVRLVRPIVTARVSESGELNFLRLAAEIGLLPEEGAEPVPDETPEESAEPLIVDVDSIRIDEGVFRFLDRSQQPSFEVEVAPLDLQVDAFTTRLDTASTYVIDVGVGALTRLHWEGSFGVDPLKAEGRIELEDLDLALLWDYLSDVLRFEVRDGRLDLAIRYEAELGETLGLHIVNSSLTVEGLDIRDPDGDREVLTLPSLGVNGIEASIADGAAREVGVEGVEVAGGRLAARLDAAGALDLVELFTGAPQPSETAAVAEDGAAGATATEGGNAGEPKIQSDGPAPAIRVDRVVVRDFAVDFEDGSTTPPATIGLAPIALRIDGYSSEPGGSIKISFESGIGDGGRLRVEGPVVLDPLEIRLAVETEDVAIADLQPYVADVAALEVESGRLTAAVDLEVVDAGEPAPGIGVKGRVQIDGLATRDRRNRDPFLGWRVLRLEGIDYGAGGVRLAEVALDGADARVVVAPDGRTNLASIFASTEAEDASRGDASASSEPDSGEPLRLRLDRIRLDGLSLAVEDRSIEPAFATVIEELSGRIDGLSSAEGSRPKIDLAGRMGGTAPLSITGDLNPLGSAPLGDILVRLNGFPLSAVSTYSGRYVGYEVASGTLDLSLDYSFSADALEAENRFVLDRFAFGEEVESPDATSLPVVMALALMRDADRRIDINLPISGHPSDPDFDVMGLLGKAATNLITKVAASPFTMVGGLVGRSGEEIASAGFEPGISRLTPGQASQVGTLSTALAERPGVGVEILGRADPSVDGPALVRQRIEDDVRKRVYDSLPWSERRRISDPAELVPTAEQRLAALRQLHRERAGAGAPPPPIEDAPGPGAAIAALVADLESRIELGESDWKALATARAESIRGALLASGEVAPERVKLVEVEVGAVAVAGTVPTGLALTD